MDLQDLQRIMTVRLVAIVVTRRTLTARKLSKQCKGTATTIAMVAMATIRNNLNCATVNDIPSTQLHLMHHQNSQLAIVGVITVVIDMNLETVQERANREQ